MFKLVESFIKNETGVDVIFLPNKLEIKQPHFEITYKGVNLIMQNNMLEYNFEISLLGEADTAFPFLDKLLIADNIFASFFSKNHLLENGLRLETGSIEESNTLLIDSDTAQFYQFSRNANFKILKELKNG